MNRSFSRLNRVVATKSALSVSRSGQGFGPPLTHLKAYENHPALHGCLPSFFRIGSTVLGGVILLRRRALRATHP
jgi:hypothetical protein